MIWGRGALDMKGGIAMLVAAFLRAKIEGASLPGDVVLAVVSDEEEWGTYGARFLVEQHPEQFAGMRYAIGEFGGFSIGIGPRVFYPIMVAEKQGAHVRATLRGPGGHGSLPARGGAAAKLGRFLTRLDRRRLPVHITPVSAAMIATVADALPAPHGPVLRQVLNPRLTDRVLDVLARASRRSIRCYTTPWRPPSFAAGRRGTCCPARSSWTWIAGCCRDSRRRRCCVSCAAWSGATRNSRSWPSTRIPLVSQTWGCSIRSPASCARAIPRVIPTPYLLSGVTDGRFFSRLGIQTYGFLPMRLPPDLPFSALIHAADERIPADAPAFGANAIYQALQRFGSAT